jgi:hypothetical protein
MSECQENTGTYKTLVCVRALRPEVTDSIPNDMVQKGRPVSRTLLVFGTLPDAR